MGKLMDRDIDVFLGFSSEAREVVEKIAVYLKDKAGLQVWFDEWRLIPGESAIDNIERGLQAAVPCSWARTVRGRGSNKKSKRRSSTRSKTRISR